MRSRLPFQILGLAAFVSVCLALAFAVLSLDGCLAMRQSEAASRYAAQLVSCVDEYDAGPARDACQDDVRRRWGRLDAGGDR